MRTVIGVVKGVCPPAAGNLACGILLFILDASKPGTVSKFIIPEVNLEGGIVPKPICEVVNVPLTSEAFKSGTKDAANLPPA